MGKGQPSHNAMGQTNPHPKDRPRQKADQPIKRQTPSQKAEPTCPHQDTDTTTGQVGSMHSTGIHTGCIKKIPLTNSLVGQKIKGNFFLQLKDSELSGNFGRTEKWQNVVLNKFNCITVSCAGELTYSS